MRLTLGAGTGQKTHHPAIFAHSKEPCKKNIDDYHDNYLNL